MRILPCFTKKVAPDDTNTISVTQENNDVLRAPTKSTNIVQKA